ncbi:MAG: hypothetical protein GY928_11255 [Colwellia sp.]|nr:hypothetical protein [Colwellia sp.]
MLKELTHFYSNYIKIDLLKHLIISSSFTIIVLIGAGSFSHLPIELQQTSNIIVLCTLVFSSVFVLSTFMVTTNLKGKFRLGVFFSFLLYASFSYVHNVIFYEIGEQKTPTIYVFYQHDSLDSVDRLQLKSVISNVSTLEVFKGQKFVIKPISLHFQGEVEGSLLENHLKKTKNVIGYVEVNSAKSFSVIPYLFTFDALNSLGIKNIRVSQNSTSDGSFSYTLELMRDWFLLSASLGTIRHNYSFGQNASYSFGYGFRSLQSVNVPGLHEIPVITTGVKTTNNLLDSSIHLAINNVISNYMFINGAPEVYCSSMEKVLLRFSSSKITETMLLQENKGVHRLISCVKSSTNNKLLKVINEIIKTSDDDLLKAYFTRLIDLRLIDMLSDTNRSYRLELEKINNFLLSCKTKSLAIELMCLLKGQDKVRGSLSDKGLFGELLFDLLHEQYRKFVRQAIQDKEVGPTIVSDLINQAHVNYTKIGAERLVCKWDWPNYLYLIASTKGWEEGVDSVQKLIIASECNTKDLNAIGSLILELKTSKVNTLLKKWKSDITPQNTLIEAYNLIFSDLIKSFNLDSDKEVYSVLHSQETLEKSIYHLQNAFLEHTINNNQLDWLEKIEGVFSILYLKLFDTESTLEDWQGLMSDFSFEDFNRIEMIRAFLPKNTELSHFSYQLLSNTALRLEDLNSVIIHPELHQSMTYGLMNTFDKEPEKIHNYLDELESLYPGQKETLTHKHFRAVAFILQKNYLKAVPIINDIINNSTKNRGFYHYILNVIKNSQDPMLCEDKNYNDAEFLSFIAFFYFEGNSQVDAFELRTMDTHEEFEKKLGIYLQASLEMTTHFDNSKLEANSSYKYKYNPWYPPCSDRIKFSSAL